MPFYLRERNVVDELSGRDSVLIVVCRFCPAASMAARHGLTYLEPLRRGLTTECFEPLVSDMRTRLEGRGCRTSGLHGHLRNFVVCMWSEGQKRKLRRIAAEHDAVVVMGCRGAVESVARIVGSLPCRVYPGMEDEAVLSVTPKLAFPLRIALDRFELTPVYWRPDGTGQQPHPAA